MAVAKKAATRKPRSKPDQVFYVLSERSHFFSWNPIKVFENYDLAKLYKDQFEAYSKYGLDGYKITSVKLAKDKPSAGEIITLP